MTKFLDDLKNAVEIGEFNSEAAKKIIEIDKLADGKDITEVQEKLKTLETKTVDNVTEQEALAVNLAYEKKMFEIKQQDLANAQLATLIECENMVKASIGDMMSFVTELETKFENEFKTENPIFGDLHLKIETINKDYENLI